MAEATLIVAKVNARQCRVFTCEGVRLYPSSASMLRLSSDVRTAGSPNQQKALCPGLSFRHQHIMLDLCKLESAPSQRPACI
jgi:hypothetical protein